MRLLTSALLCLFTALAFAIPTNPDIDFAGPPPGKAEITKSDAQTIGLQNSVLSASWSLASPAKHSINPKPRSSA